jgi:hypothetical protein
MNVAENGQPPKKNCNFSMENDDHDNPLGFGASHFQIRETLPFDRAAPFPNLSRKRAR